MKKAKFIKRKKPNRKRAIILLIVLIIVIFLFYNIEAIIEGLGIFTTE
jgi:hypothetical protein